MDVVEQLMEDELSELTDLVLSRSSLVADLRDLEGLRKKARLSQGDIASFLGCTTGAISRWESGQRFPTPRQQKRVGLLVAHLRELVS